MTDLLRLFAGPSRCTQEVDEEEAKILKSPELSKSPANPKADFA